MKGTKRRTKSELSDGPPAKKAFSEDAASTDWDDDVHQKFVASIFEIGLRNASPAVILENMTQKSASITSERVKSKLQKYRKNKDKSREEFNEEYEAFLQRLRALDSAGAGTSASDSPMALLEMLGSNKMLGGDVAAFLSYAVMRERMTMASGEGDGAIISSQLLKKGALEYVEHFAGTGIPFPELTEEEKKSSLGISMTFVMGLFLSMSQYLASSREQQQHSNSSSEDDSKTVPTVDTKPAAMEQPGSFSLDNATQQALRMTKAAFMQTANGIGKSDATQI